MDDPSDGLDSVVSAPRPESLLAVHSETVPESDGPEPASTASSGPQLPGHLEEVQRHYFMAQYRIRCLKAVVATVPYPDPVTGEEKRLPNVGALQTCLKRAALGLTWLPGHKGGQRAYLCQDDADGFKRILQDRAEKMNCVTTPTAVRLARRLRGIRQRKAIGLLESIGLGGTAAQLRSQVIKDPDPTWLNHFAERMDLHLKNPQPIEQARRRACNTVAIETFFERFGALMQRPKCLIINCDETHISSRKKFKVVVPQGLLPLREPSPKIPHFSAMCTISASGHKFPPTFILPELQTLPNDLSTMSREAYFLSTPTGWMNQHAFLFYCHILIYELSLYRQTLPVEHIGQRFLLLLDGHSSRWTHEAMNLLNESGIDVLVFPAHYTHMLQPFDVSVAAALKQALKRFCQAARITQNELDELELSEIEPFWLGEKRRVLFEAFMNAWSVAASRANIRSGFEACGICPLNPQRPLESQFTSKVFPDRLFPPPSGESRRNELCARDFSREISSFEGET
jgi:hypothetical protein